MKSHPNGILKIAAISAIGGALATANAEDASAVSGTLSFDLNSHFVSYGFDVWAGASSPTSAYTFNPSLELSWELTDCFSVVAGTWWDVNGNPGPGAAPTTGSDLQEVDIWFGGTYTYDKFSVTGLYQAWFYADNTEHIVDLILAYDTLLAPSLTIHNRLDAGASGGQTGTILVAGVDLAACTEDGLSLGPVSIGIPLNIAYFMDGDFHGALLESGGFGYGSIGVEASYPLGFIDPKYGEWDVHGGVTYYVTDQVKTGNNVAGKEGDFLTYNFGIGCAF